MLTPPNVRYCTKCLVLLYFIVLDIFIKRWNSDITSALPLVAFHGGKAGVVESCTYFVGTVMRRTVNAAAPDARGG